MREIRRLKARMESERLPRGADPTLHAKLGPRRADRRRVDGAAAPAAARLRRSRACAPPAPARPWPPPARPGSSATEDAQTLDEAWVLATRVRNAVMLVRGRAGDTFPSDARELGAVGRYLGYGPGPRRATCSTTTAV